MAKIGAEMGNLRVVVVGGSLGGLTAALVLRDAGCDVHLYERSPTALEGRGAGIVLHPLSERYLVSVSGLPVDSFATRAAILRYVDGDGETLDASPVNYRFTAWNTLYRRLLHELPAGSYHLGETMTGIDDATVEFEKGRRVEFDLLVCADGLRSTARSRFLPEVRPSYAGYVGWRGTLPLDCLAAGARHSLANEIVYHLTPGGGHVLTYPILGSGTDAEVLMNFVWYRNAAEPELAGLMLDAAGSQRELAVPAGMVAPRNLEALRADAERLPPAIREFVQAAPEPFIQQIVDVEVPRMAFGRVVLVGDAAFVARPHAAAGTAKAAADAWALREELERADFDVERALPAWERRQLALGHDLLRRVRTMGDAVQFGSGWTPGARELRFGLYRAGDSEEEAK